MQTQAVQMGALMMPYVNLHRNLPVLHLKCNSCALKNKTKHQLVGAFFRIQSDKFVQSGPFPKRLFPTKTWRAQAIWLMTISRCRLGGAGAGFDWFRFWFKTAELLSRMEHFPWHFPQTFTFISFFIRGQVSCIFLKMKTQSFPLIKLLEYLSEYMNCSWIKSSHVTSSLESVFHLTKR